MPSLWLVDGSHAIFRAYHALPHLSTRQGVPTNAVYGFTTMLLRAIREGNPTHLAIAFDEEGKQARSEIYPEYKATRGAPPDDLRPQFPLARRVLAALNVPAVGMPGGEADDDIATLARRARSLGWEVLIVTGDKDLLQLVDGSVRCYDSMYEKWYGPAEVEEKWGVPPHLVADLLALTGDKIDNVPGIPGGGEKTAAALLKELGSLDQVLARAGEIKTPKLDESAFSPSPVRTSHCTTSCSESPSRSPTSPSTFRSGIVRAVVHRERCSRPPSWMGGRRSPCSARCWRTRRCARTGTI